MPLAAGMVLSGAAAAAGAPLPAAAQATCTPVATGLASPRFAAVADDGSIYVTEAGTGGAEQVPSPQPGSPPSTRGLSAQITRIAPNGAKSVVAGNLPSYFSPAEGAVGPAGIVIANNALWVLVGGAGPAYPTLTPLQNEASLIRVPLAGGAPTRVADLGAYEKANNPGGFAVDTDPYGLALGRDGMIYAADAGGNTVYRINPADGQLAVAAVIPGIAVPAGALPPGGNPARGGASEIDPVPTGVATGSDGNVYVALLSGFPFPQGGAKIVRLNANGTVTDFARGLTMATGLATGPDRNLYVSEISTNFNITSNPPQIAPGRVQRVLADGRTQVVADNIPAPNGIAFDRAGNLYVVANSAFTPPQAGNAGQVLRCNAVAAAAGLPRTGTGPARSGFGFGGLAGAALAGAGLIAAAGVGLARRRVR